MTDLITRLADELEHASRADHYDSTGEHRFDECLSQLCTSRRALLREAREAAARAGEDGQALAWWTAAPTDVVPLHADEWYGDAPPMRVGQPGGLPVFDVGPLMRERYRLT